MNTITSRQPLVSTSPVVRSEKQKQRRVLLGFVVFLGVVTVAAATHVARPLTAGWSEVHYAIASCSVQLLALVGLFIAALHVEKIREADAAAARARAHKTTPSS